METSQLSASQARLKLTILSKQAEAKNSYEVYSEMKGLGLPDDIIAILRKILAVTSKVAGKVIAIGKIIVIHLLDYVAKHPLQAAGITVGLGVTFTLGVGLHGLFAMVPGLAGVPILGGLLSKLALLIASICKTVFVPIMAIAPVVGGVAGEILDQKFPAINEGLQQAAKDFFEFLGKLINAIKDELELDTATPAFA